MMAMMTPKRVRMMPEPKAMKTAVDAGAELADAGVGIGLHAVQAVEAGVELANVGVGVGFVEAGVGVGLHVIQAGVDVADFRFDNCDWRPGGC